MLVVKTTKLRWVNVLDGSGMFFTIVETSDWLRLTLLNFEPCCKNESQRPARERLHLVIWQRKWLFWVTFYSWRWPLKRQLLQKRDSRYAKGKRFGDETFSESGRLPNVVDFEIEDGSEEENPAVPAGSGTVSGVRSCSKGGNPNRTPTVFGRSASEAMAKENPMKQVPFWVLVLIVDSFLCQQWVYPLCSPLWKLPEQKITPVSQQKACWRTFLSSISVLFSIQRFKRLHSQETNWCNSRELLARRHGWHLVRCWRIFFWKLSFMVEKVRMSIMLLKSLHVLVVLEWILRRLWLLVP